MTVMPGRCCWRCKLSQNGSSRREQRGSGGSQMGGTASSLLAVREERVQLGVRRFMAPGAGAVEAPLGC